MPLFRLVQSGSGCYRSSPEHRLSRIGHQIKNRGWVEYNQQMIQEHVSTNISREFVKYQEKLGQGAFGTVFQGRNRQTGQWVAVKQLNADVAKDWRGHGDSRRETEVLKQIAHENVVRFEGTVENPNHIYVITQFCDRGSLRSALQQKMAANPSRGLSESTVLRYFTEIVNGMVAANQKGVIHRDLKPENILLASGTDKLCHVKIADFGLARKIIGTDIHKLEKYSNKGTPMYAAPEVLQKMEFSGKCDVWSCGLIILELLTGVHLFRDAVNIANLTQLQKERQPIEIPSSFDRIFQELLPQMLRYKDQDRISFEQLQEQLQKQYRQAEQRISEKETEDLFGQLFRYADYLFERVRLLVDLMSQLNGLPGYPIDNGRRYTLIFLQLGVFFTSVQQLKLYLSQPVLKIPSGDTVEKETLPAKSKDELNEYIDHYSSELGQRQRKFSGTIEQLCGKLLSQSYRQRFPELYQRYPDIYEELEPVRRGTFSRPLEWFKNQYQSFFSKECQLKEPDIQKQTEQVLRVYWLCHQTADISKSFPDTEYSTQSSLSHTREEMISASRDKLLKNISSLSKS